MGNVVGPGSDLQQSEQPHPLLEHANEFEYVEVLNPLTDDFQVMVAQDVPVNMPFEIRKDTTGKTSFITSTEADARQIYGLQLKNPDHVGKKYIHNTTVIPAGKSLRFKGNEAQVVVRQLVNEIMQREGKSKMLADAFARNAVETRIVIARGSVQDLMDNRMQTPSQVASEAINKANEVTNDQAFPGLSQIDQAETATGSQDPAPAVNRSNPNPTNSQPATAA